MKRRTMVLTLGSIFAAGCSGGPSHGGGKGAYKDDIGVGTGDENRFNFSDFAEKNDFEIGKIEHDFDFNSSQLGPNITFDFEDSGGEQDQLPTPAKSNEQAARYLQEARKNLEKALNIYAEFGGAEYDITTVSPTTDRFSSSQIRGKVSEARTPLLRATKSATEGQKVLVLALEQVGIFIKHATLSELALRNALSEYHTAMDYLEKGDTINISFPKERMRRYVSEAKEHMDVIKSETDSTSMQSLNTNVQDLYDAKVGQFNTLTDSFRTLANAIGEIGDGLAELEKGVTQYMDRQYDSAEFRLGFATSPLQMGRSDIRSVQSNGVLQDATRSSLNFVTTLYQIAQDLQQSAQAKLNYNEERYTKYRERAIEHLKSDDRTKYMAEINQIQW